jgi:hypothetical protein
MRIEGLEHEVHVELVGRNVLVVNFYGVKAGWRMPILLSADRHDDNPHSIHALQDSHLARVANEGGLIFDFGDMHCAMQGKYDPRKAMGDTRKGDDVPAYYDAIGKGRVAHYEKYARHWLLAGYGNHETSVIDRHGVDLVQRFVAGMRQADPLSPITAGGYGGWVRFHFHIQGNTRQCIDMKYFHGGGGGGPVTRGVIDTNRQAVYLPDAQIVVNGHTHDQYVLPIPRERLNAQNNVVQDVAYHIRTGTYKDEYGDGAMGWSIEKKMGPKPIGAVFGAFEYQPTSRVGMRFELATRGAESRDWPSSEAPAAEPAPMPAEASPYKNLPVISRYGRIGE